MSADAQQLPIWLTPLLQTAIIGGVSLLIAAVRAVGRRVDAIGKTLTEMHVTVYGVEGTEGLTSTTTAHGRDLTALREWRKEVDTERRLQDPFGRRATDHPSA